VTIWVVVSAAILKTKLHIFLDINNNYSTRQTQYLHCGAKQQLKQFCRTDLAIYIFAKVSSFRLNLEDFSNMNFFNQNIKYRMCALCGRISSRKPYWVGTITEFLFNKERVLEQNGRQTCLI